MKINRVILDLDEVLNVITLDLLRFDGIEMRSFDEYDSDQYDIIGMVAKMKGEPRMNIADYWNRIPRRLWANATRSDEFDEILDFCGRKVGLANTIVATTPTKCPECMAGKYEWIENNLPPELQRNWAITPRKWWFGRDDTALIDDLESNTEEMIKQGGGGINVPRPWNRWWGVPVMEAISVQWSRIEAGWPQPISTRLHIEA